MENQTYCVIVNNFYCWDNNHSIIDSMHGDFKREY